MLQIESLDLDEDSGAGDTIENLDDSDEDAELLDRELAQRRREAEAIYGADKEFDQDAVSWNDLFAEADTYTITKMTQGVRDPNRVNIFLDGHFAFSLDVSQVVELDVKLNQKVTTERLKTLQHASEFGKMYQRTLEWALTRPHSKREAQDYMKRRKLKRTMLNRQRAREEKRPLPELQDDVMAQVIERLTEKGYLDDLKFAKFYAENRLVRRGASQKRLRMELKRKGVNDDDIRIALETVPRPEDEEIMKVIKKKRKKYDDFKLVAYLVRQGFDFQKAKAAVANYRPEDELES